MIRITTSILLLSLVVLQPQHGTAADAQATNLPAVSPWSAASPFMRVPKDLLKDLTIHSVGHSSYGPIEFILPDQFVQTFLLTPDEVDRMTTSLAQSIQQLRTEKAKHFVATVEPVHLPNPMPAASEEFAFRLEPFAEQKAAILDDLKRQVRSILGDERSEWFWRCGGMLLNNQMHCFGPGNQPYGGNASTTTYTFMLRKSTAGTNIDLRVSTVGPDKDGRLVGGGEEMGYPQSLDPYAPESMKPILARWRKLIGGNQARTVSLKAQPNPSTPVNQPVDTNSTVIQTAPSLSGATDPARKWEDGVPYVDLPKDLLRSFSIVALTDEDEISPTAKALFGLSELEHQAVTDLYTGLKGQFEQIERGNLVRLKPTEYHFVVRRFPRLAKDLQWEWRQKLSQIVGTNRAELLNASIRNTWGPRLSRQPDRNLNQAVAHQKGPSWLDRGLSEIRIDMVVDKGNGDELNIRGFEWKADDGRRGKLSIHPGAAGLKAMPERWRHLITPEILTMPPLL